MLILENIETENDDGFIIENGILKEPSLNARVKIIKYPTSNIYEISLHQGDTSFINEKLNCTFQNLLKYHSNFLFYELELRNLLIDKDIIGEFKPIFRVHYAEEIAKIKVDLLYISGLFGTLPHVSSNSKWSTNYILNQLNLIAKEDNSIIRYEEDDRNRFGIEYIFDKNEIISKSIAKVILELNRISLELSKKITEFKWKDEYFSNEIMFSNEVILPLLRKMKFHGIKFTHGNDEFGRDFIFKDATKFSTDITFGIQAKAGNLSGKANGKIEELINQVKIALKTPYKEIADNNDYYISVMIIAISGKYTNQAQKILLGEIPSEFKGSVFFWDKEKILELIEKYWLQ